MDIKLKENCKYALLVPTSMGLRITPAAGQPVHSSDMFALQATSAETNVASISSFLGLPVKVLTTFVKDRIASQQAAQAIRLKYVDEFAAVLAPEQLCRLYDVEGQIQHKLKARKNEGKPGQGPMPGGRPGKGPRPADRPGPAPKPAPVAK